MKQLRQNKLFIIGPTESSLTKRGNRFPNIADSFLDSNFDVVYFTSNFYHAEKRFFSKNEIRLTKEKSPYELNIIKVIRYTSNVSPRRVLSNVFFSLKLFFILLFKVKKQDSILLPSRPVELIFFVALLKRLKGVKIYLDIQDVWPDALKIDNQFKKKVFTSYCNFYLKRSLKYYTNTMHVAPSFKMWLHRYAKNTPSIFIPLGWENNRWNKNGNDLTKQDSESIKLVCVAQLQRQINVLPLLESIKGKSNLHLTIIGEDGSGERYREVKEYIDKNNILNVEIIGKVEREKMASLLLGKDIGVLPMISSSIPNKIFDYMATNLPIIVLGDNDSSDFVSELKIGWSCDFTSDGFSKLISNISTADIEFVKAQVVNKKLEYSRDYLHLQIKNMIE